MKRYSYISETLCFFVVTLIIGRMHGNIGFINYDLHPFYLIILLVALRYGYMQGLFPTLCSSSLYALFYIFDKAGINMTDFNRLAILFNKLKTSDIGINDFWETAYHPLAFLAFGMFVGLLADRDKKSIKQLHQTVTDLKRTNSKLRSEYEEIAAINENISNQLVQTDQTFNILFYKTRNLFHEDITIFYQTCHDILLHITQASEGYMLVLEGNSFRLAFPQNTHKNGMSYLVHNRELFETVRQSKSFIRVDMVEGHLLSEYTPIFIGPIMHQATNTLYGLIVVQEMEALRYTDNMFLTFKNYCKWIGEIFYVRMNQSYSVSPSLTEKDDVFDYLVQLETSKPQIKTDNERIFL